MVHGAELHHGPRAGRKEFLLGEAHRLGFMLLALFVIAGLGFALYLVSEKNAPRQALSPQREYADPRFGISFVLPESAVAKDDGAAAEGRESTTVTVTSGTEKATVIAAAESLRPVLLAGFGKGRRVISVTRGALTLDRYAAADGGYVYLYENAGFVYAFSGSERLLDGILNGWKR